jgi:proteasome lid subunit RPN8/RPN11
MTLAPGLLEQIIEHAQACYPLEGCGLIAGPRAGEAARFIAMDNVLGSSTAYEMDPAQLIRTMRDLRESGQELVAIYHSHPFGPANPSATDVQRAYYPDAIHVIVSLSERERPRAAAFVISAGEILEVDLRVIV